MSRLRGTGVSPFAISGQIARLLEVFPRPKHWPPEDTRVAILFAETCADVSAEQFTQAVTGWLQSDHRFAPTPGQLRTLAQAQPGASVLPTGDREDRFLAWLRAPWDASRGPCPICARDIGEPRAAHEHAAHERQGVRCHGRCDAPPGVCASPHRPAPPRAPRSDQRLTWEDLRARRAKWLADQPPVAAPASVAEVLPAVLL